jgi:hypothetical protein
LALPGAVINVNKVPDPADADLKPGRADTWQWFTLIQI